MFLAPLVVTKGEPQGFTNRIFAASVASILDVLG